MKIAGTAALTACLLTASPALAQVAAPADTKAISDCLKIANDAGQFGGGCVGIIADPCIKGASTKNSYIDDSKKCAAREDAVWVELARRALEDVKKGGFKKITDAANEAQKAFAQSRDKLCPAFEGLDPGMAMGGGTYCRLQENARRALQLRRLGAAVNEH
jgi:hypothetical protein